MVLVIYPKFDNRWRDCLLDETNLKFIEFDEHYFFKHGTFWKAMQAIVFIVDMILPRKLAISSVIRKLRLKNKYLKLFWTEVLKDATKFTKIIVIKPTGLKREYFPSKFDLENNLKGLLSRADQLDIT